MDAETILEEPNFHYFPTLIYQGEHTVGHVIGNLKDMKIINHPTQLIRLEREGWKDFEKKDVTVALPAGATAASTSQCIIIPKVTDRIFPCDQDHYQGAVKLSPEVDDHLRRKKEAYMITGLRFCEGESSRIYAAAEGMKQAELQAHKDASRLLGVQVAKLFRKRTFVREDKHILPKLKKGLAWKPNYKKE